MVSVSSKVQERNQDLNSCVDAVVSDVQLSITESKSLPVHR